MTNTPAITTPTALAIRSEQTYWDDKQMAALSQLGLRSAPAGDLAVFFHQSKRTGLDPFARQIYMIERKGRWGIQTSIDGFRVIADRSCAVRGWIRSEEDTIWYDETGAAHTEPIKKPTAARYTCLILTPSGQARFSAVARYDEYAGTGPMWSRMPALMIAKCAEALALRKAFPQDLSGLYTDDEMSQADVQQPRQTVTPTRVEVTAAVIEDATPANTAKRLLLETCEGDKEKARGIWEWVRGDINDQRTLTQEELSALLAIAKGEGIAADAEIVETVEVQ